MELEGIDGTLKSYGAIKVAPHCTVREDTRALEKCMPVYCLFRTAGRVPTLEVLHVKSGRGRTNSRCLSRASELQSYARGG